MLGPKSVAAQTLLFAALPAKYSTVPKRAILNHSELQVYPAFD